MAATAIATAVIKFCAIPSRRTISESTNITTVTASTNAVMNLPSLFRLFSSGVEARFASESIAAILPISVFIPVAKTTAVAVPLKTYDEEKSMLFCAERGAFSAATMPSPLCSPTLSPVRALSSHFKAAQFIILQSAGTISPSERLITSPGTSAKPGTERSFPSRRHLTSHTESFLRFSMARSARNC